MYIHTSENMLTEHENTFSPWKEKREYPIGKNAKHFSRQRNGKYYKRNLFIL